MKINDYGQVILNSQDIFEGLYSGKLTSLQDLNIDDQNIIEQFNQARAENADPVKPLAVFQQTLDSIKDFDSKNQEDWFMPAEYHNFEIIGFLLDKTTNEEEYQRVVTELELFDQHNMIGLLKYLKYLVDTMRENKIVWGVGRGSSVASYVLYLMGVHKINSLKYNLDIKEFLK
jgi:DNA polymerase III alpha subunit